MPEKETVSEPSPPNTPEDLTLGQYLCNERERRSLSIEELHRKTGLQLSVITALENDQRHELPADVFVKGFIKLYAKALDLDPQYALALFQNANEPLQKKKEVTHKELLSSETLAESPLLFTKKKLLFALFVLLLLVLAYVLSLFRPFHDFSWRDYFPSKAIVQSPTGAPPTNVEKQAVQATSPERIRPVQKEESRPIAAEQAEPQATRTAGKTEKAEMAPAMPAEQPQTQPSPIDHVAGMNAGTNRSAIEKEREPDEKSSATVQTSTDEQASTPEQASGKPAQTLHTLTATFSEMTWVRIVIDDSEIKESFFRPGATATWQADKKIEILLGNSGGATLNFDGNPVKLNGSSGKVRRITLP